VFSAGLGLGAKEGIYPKKGTRKSLEEVLDPEKGRLPLDYDVLENPSRIQQPELWDMTELIKEFPSLELPTPSDIEELRLGYGVKVSYSNEHFWCQLVGNVFADNQFYWIGVIHNDLVGNHSLKRNDLILIEGRHIRKIEK
jgi:hypothetical protein